MSLFLKSALLIGLLAALPANAAEFVAKLASQDPPTTAKHRGLLKAAALVKERTKGAVEIQVFPSSQLGGAREMGEGVQLGSLEAMIAPASFLGGFNPAVSIFDVPYIFPTDREKSRRLREGKLGQTVLESFRKRGFEPIALWSGGRKQFTSNKPLNDIAAIAGQRFRVMDSKILIGQFSALGASAIVLPFGELYTALQTGVIDGQENPLDTISTMKFHEVQKNLVVTEHGVMEDVVLFNPGWWKKLPAAHREVIVKAFDEVRPEFEKSKDAAQNAALEVIRASGKTHVRIADEKERARMREAMYPRSRTAYLERAGAEGKKLVALYEQERKKLGN